MELVDTHAHLSDSQFDADRPEVLRRAGQALVNTIVEIADSPADWLKAAALSREYPSRLRCSLGLHPYYAADYSEDLLRRLELAARGPEVAAVGEIGLDYARSEVPAEIQKKAFESLAAAALAWGKPAVIHCRAAYKDLRDILKSLVAGPPAHQRYWGVVHCFSGDADDATFLAGLGFALGVDGPVTYPKNEGLREAFRRAGPSALVLETDSPYLPPQSSRGKRNEPANLPEIASGLAKALGLPIEELARMTTANARALFGLKGL